MKEISSCVSLHTRINTSYIPKYSIIINDSSIMGEELPLPFLISRMNQSAKNLIY
jgi:hypothetical protein